MRKKLFILAFFILILAISFNYLFGVGGPLDELTEEEARRLDTRPKELIKCENAVYVQDKMNIKEECDKMGVEVEKCYLSEEARMRLVAIKEKALEECQVYNTNQLEY